MMYAMRKSTSRKVNGYVKAVLALEAVRQKREERYTRYVRPLDRKRDLLAAEVDRRLRALIGTQLAEARRIPGEIKGGLDQSRRRAELSDRVIRTAKWVTIIAANPDHRDVFDERQSGNALVERACDARCPRCREQRAKAAQRTR